MTTEFWTVIHGTCAIFEYNDGIDVHVPSRPECVYRAGGWLAETTIQPGARLELRVPAKTPRVGTFNRNHNLYFEGKLPSTRGDLYATLTLPTPDEIRSVWRRSTGVTGEDAGGQRAGAAVHAFIYRNVDLSEVKLIGHDGDRAVQSDLLSIVLDPEVEDLPTSYDVDSFRTTVALVEGLRLDWQSGARLEAGESVDVPDYLGADLYHRTSWASKLGDAIRQVLAAVPGIGEGDEPATAQLVATAKSLAGHQLVNQLPWCMFSVILRMNGNRPERAGSVADDPRQPRVDQGPGEGSAKE